MINSLELYKEALTFARNNPINPIGAFAVRNDNILWKYYLQLITIIFYELTVKKNSPLISFLWQFNIQGLAPKNFSLSTGYVAFNMDTSYDMYEIILGMNVAFTENLDSCQGVYLQCKQNIFRGVQLNPESWSDLFNYLATLDDALGKIFAPVKVVEKVVEQRVEVSVEKIADDADKDFLQNLSALAEVRRADDEKIADEIKKVQLALQEELPRLQSTLKTIAEIRDGIDFKTMQEPINQLIQLFDKLHETLQRHPLPDMQKGYDTLLKRCRNFSRYIEQSLGMLGAELIAEVNVPVDFSRHTVTNANRPPEGATVSKILRVGLLYKGQVLRKAEVEITEPPAAQTVTSTFAGAGFGKFFRR